MIRNPKTGYAWSNEIQSKSSLPKPNLFIKGCFLTNIPLKVQSVRLHSKIYEVNPKILSVIIYFPAGTYFGR